jgi:hypothetical protein
LKTAKALQKQVDELSISRQGIKGRFSETLSNSLDPDNFRKKAFQQFISKQISKRPTHSRTQRLAGITTASDHNSDESPPTPQINLEQEPVEQENPARYSTLPESVVPVLEDDKTEIEPLVKPHIITDTISDETSISSKLNLPSILNTRSVNSAMKEDFFSSFLKKRHDREDS